MRPFFPDKTSVNNEFIRGAKRRTTQSSALNCISRVMRMKIKAAWTFDQSLGLFGRRAIVDVIRRLFCLLARGNLMGI